MVASASKYAIVSLTVGQVLVGRNSVKAIKQEFQRLVGENQNDIVVLDYTGETMVRFIGGKILKGQNYRKFTRRGTKAPAPKPVACEVPTIQNVCQDVIHRIDLQKIVAQQGALMSLKVGDELVHCSEIKNSFGETLSAQTVVNENVCHVCGKGAILASWVGLYNNFSNTQMANCGYDLDYTAYKWPQELMILFGRVLLDKIEVAFEGSVSFEWTSDEIEHEDRRELVNKYYYAHSDETERLRAIMCDVRDGKF